MKTTPITLLAILTLIPSISFAGGAQKLFEQMKEKGKITIRIEGRCELNLNYDKIAHQNDREIISGSLWDFEERDSEFFVLNDENPYAGLSLEGNTLKMSDQQSGTTSKTLTVKTDNSGKPISASFSSAGFGMDNFIGIPLPEMEDGDCSLK